jgi:hypothetical protein
MSFIYHLAPEDKKIWGLIGLAIAIVYSAMASINYNIQAVAVRQSLATGQTMGIAMLLPDHPHGVFLALANSYVYMGLAMFFAAFVFSGSRLVNWVRWIFLLQFLTALGQVRWTMFDLPMSIFIGTSMAWVVGPPLGFILLAVHFRNSSVTSSPT